jgi:PilZ domain
MTIGNRRSADNYVLWAINQLLNPRICWNTIEIGIVLITTPSGIRTGATVIFWPLRRRAIVNLDMPFPQSNSQRRAPRVKFGDPLSATVLLQDGQRANGALQTISVTGGLLRLAQALSQGDFVEVSFQTQSGQVQGLAEMLTPVRRLQDATVQPFRFVALADNDHRVLRMIADTASDRSFFSSRQPAAQT